MKILVASPLPPPVGGIASWTKDIIEYFDNNNIDYHVINTAITGKRAKEVSKRFLIDELLRAIKCRKAIKKAVKTGSFDVLHYSASCSMVGLIRDFFVLMGIGVDIVYHCHCNLDYVINNKISETFFKMICKIASFVIALNTPSLKVAQRYTSKCAYVPNFIPRVYEDNKIISDEIKTAVFVGRLTKQKGIYELLAAAKELENVEILLIGPNDGNIEFSNQPNVKLVGRKSHEEVMEYLKKADVLLFPSYTEGFPLTVLEAMSCGLPIVATGVGAIPDMIGDTGGIIIDSPDATRLVEAVKAIEDKNLRAEMSKNNIHKVKECYLRDSVLKQLLSIYTSLGGNE